MLRPKVLTQNAYYFAEIDEKKSLNKAYRKKELMKITLENYVKIFVLFFFTSYLIYNFSQFINLPSFSISLNFLGLFEAS